MSKREELRKKRQAQTRRTQMMVMGGIVLIAIAVTSYLIYQNTRPIGEINVIAKETWPEANGKVLGSPEAKVLIKEFSDFQ
jgi:hypothetical protein